MKNILSIVAALTLTMAAGANAASISLGSAASYAFVGLGNGKTTKMNSGPINGAVLVGNGTNVDTSGGGDGGQGITTWYYDSTVPAGSSTGLENAPTEQLVANSVTAAAAADANALSALVEGLLPTQTIVGTLEDGSLTGNGGINVINVGGIKNELTLTGGAGDYFLFNVAEAFDSNKAMVLNGVDPSQILFNLLGTSGDVFKTAGGNLSFGTFLATRGGDFQFSNLVLNGALVNTAGAIQFVSGSEIPNFTPFSPVPLPAAAWLFGSALFGLVAVARRKRV